MHRKQKWKSKKIIGEDRNFATEYCIFFLYKYSNAMQKNAKKTFPWNVLLNWYLKNGRTHLPWRDYSFPAKELTYRVWIAEILLQQTQAERVVPYFQKILEAYPTIQALAWASYEEFFPYYQWMGYYSRAKNILKTANIISDQYDGVFPIDKKLLQKLPWVWWYTSSAILAFGYGEPYLAWDTNLEKVFARYYNGTKNIKLTEEEKEEIESDFWEFIEKIFQKKDNTSNKNTRFLHMQEWQEPSEYGLLRAAQSQKQDTVRAINNALMDFASIIDKKNPETIDWDTYFLRESAFYETRGSLEPKVTKKISSFPIPDATILVILHENHKLYYSPAINEQYVPFTLAPGLTRDTRKYVQEYFRTHYALELSVRPVHKKWLSKDGKPYIAVNAQVQVGKMEQFRTFEKKEAQKILKEIIEA
jgi:A/G-specific adenine glycosylase